MVSSRLSMMSPCQVSLLIFKKIYFMCVSMYTHLLPMEAKRAWNEIWLV